MRRSRQPACARHRKTCSCGARPCGGEILVSRAISASAGGQAPMQAAGATRRSTGRRSGERWRTRSRRLGSVTGLGPSRSLQVQANGLFTHRPFGPRFSAATRACRAKNPAMAATTLRRRLIAERSLAPWSRGSCLVGFLHPPQPAPRVSAAHSWQRRSAAAQALITPPRPAQPPSRASGTPRPGRRSRPS
jgi:hypothetical protein